MPGEIEIKFNGSVSNIFIDGTDISNMCVVGEVKTREEDKVNDLKPEILKTLLYIVEHGVFNSDEIIKTAMAVLREELMKHGDLYNGFLASIESALEEKISYAELWENDICIESDKWAKAVMSRIIGED